MGALEFHLARRLHQRHGDENSLNHYAYGSIVDWMYRNLCGLNPVEEAPGFKKAVIRPMPDARLSWAKMKLDSAAGTYQVAWKYVDGQLHGSVTRAL